MTTQWTTNQWISAGLMLICGAVLGCSGDVHAEEHAADPSGVAVVELFTSEGCSSCPPADALLGRIVTDADKNGQAIYPIAWHVDYWDRLGWRDPFSSAAATARQNLYATAFHADEVYTPEMIVNGQSGFVGSDQDMATQAIAKALAAPAAAHVMLEAHNSADHAIDVTFTVAGAPANAVLNVVGVESGLSVHVARGENGGRTLTHENVARAFEQVALDSAKTGHVTLTLPADADRKNVRVIAFVQTPDAMSIVGAAVATPKAAAGQ